MVQRTHSLTSIEANIEQSYKSNICSFWGLFNSKKLKEALQLFEMMVADNYITPGDRAMGKRELMELDAVLTLNKALS